MLRTTLLHDGWQLSSRRWLAPPGKVGFGTLEWLPASVPGHVHLDLHRNQVIADPFRGLHELGSQSIDEEDWVYRTTFAFEPDTARPHRVLRFEGLDTVATVLLNGVEAARHDDMFVPLVVDVSGLLRSGPNEPPRGAGLGGAGRARAAGPLLRRRGAPPRHRPLRRAGVRAQGAVHVRLGLGPPAGLGGHLAAGLADRACGAAHRRAMPATPPPGRERRADGLVRARARKRRGGASLPGGPGGAAPGRRAGPPGASGAMVPGGPGAAAAPPPGELPGATRRRGACRGRGAGPRPPPHAHRASRGSPGPGA